MIFGHFAIPVIVRRHVPRLASVPFAVSSVFPDLIDKALFWSKLDGRSRGLAHGIPFLTWSTIVLYALGGRKAALGWWLGYSSHLLFDIGSEGRLPLFYPFKRYPLNTKKKRGWEPLLHALTHPSPLEVLLLIWAAVILVFKWRALTTSPSNGRNNSPQRPQSR